MSGSERDRADDRTTNENKQRLEKLERAISARLSQTDFDAAGQGEIDRISRRLASAPENYLTPEPNDPWEEDIERNWQNLKSEFGLKSKGDTQRDRKDFPDRRRRAERRKVGDIVAENDTLEVLRYVYDGFSTVLDDDTKAAIDGIITVVDPAAFREAAENEIGNLEQELPFDFSFGGSSGPDNDEILERLEEIGGRTYGTVGIALRDLEDQLQNADQQARRNILNRFEQAFGQRFDDIDDAIDSLRDQFTQLQNLDIETVEAAFLGGDEIPGVSLPAGFSGLEREVRERAADVIDLDATADSLPSRNRRRPFADVRIREGDIERIDYGKAVNDPSIVLREDGDLAADADPAIEGVDDDTDEPDISVPEPDDPDPEPEPEPVEFVPDADEFDEDAVDLITDALEAADLTTDNADALVAFAAELSTTDISIINSAIDADAVPQPLLDRLQELFNAAGRDGRDRAQSETFGIDLLQERLGLEDMTGMQPDDIEFEGADEIGDDPDFGGGTDRVTDDSGGSDQRDRRRDVDPSDVDDLADAIGDAIGDAVDDAVGDLSDVQFENPPGMGGGGPENLRTQPNSDRPDPNQQEVDKRLAILLDNSLMKAQQWVAAEQDRLSRTDPALPPEEYWEEFGKRFYGSGITKQQFVNLTV